MKLEAAVGEGKGPKLPTHKLKDHKVQPKALQKVQLNMQIIHVCIPNFPCTTVTPVKIEQAQVKIDPDTS